MYAATAGRGGELGSDAALELKARYLMESVREPELVIERYVRDRASAAETTAGRR